MEKTRSKDGTPIAYEHSGDGPPLVLVHGTLATHHRWASILPALEKQFTVYAIDRRGRNRSGDGPTYSLEREYEDIASVVDSIGDGVNLLGHSFGALCVLEAALLTSNIRRIVAYEPPPAPISEGLMKRIQESLDAGDRVGAITTFVVDGVRMPPHEFEEWRLSPIFPTRLATVHTIPREFYAIEAYQFEPEQFTDLLVPTMMLLGGDSPPFARKNAEYWHETLPDSRIVVLPGQQHIAMDTAPNLFIDTVQNFFMEAG